MPKKIELTKEEKIKREKRRINNALADLDGNKKAVVAPLVESAAFMAVSIVELQDIINKQGYTVEYQNGEHQRGTKQSDEVKTLLVMQKNLQVTIKTLAELAPEKKERKSRLSELLNE